MTFSSDGQGIPVLVQIFLSASGAILIFTMPYYTGRLKASSLPKGATLDLEDLCAEDKNPHLLSLPKLVARLVREYSAKWVFDNINETYFPEKSTKTTLRQQGTSRHSLCRLSGLS